MISIIIPVYNVETYLRECIDSILRQTYRDIEVILVDDGSTDTSGDICEEYALKDSRVRVVHKQNGGLSSARNAGIAVAKGDYIGFVDSDDYIAPTMYESMLKTLSDDRIGVVSCGMTFVNEAKMNLSNIKYYDINKPTDICYDDYLAFYAEHLSMVPISNVWSKLYRYNLVKNLRFVEGRNNEDAYFSYHLANALVRERKNVLFIPQKLYYYRLRPNSITQTVKKPLYVDVVKNLSEMLEECAVRDPKVYARLKRSYIWNLNMCINIMREDRDVYDKYFPEIRPYLLKTPAKDFATGYTGLAKYKVIVHTLLQKLRWRLAK